MKHVLLLLAQGFEAFEASVFVDVLGWSRDIGEHPVQVTTVGRREQIQCTWNFTVIPEKQLNEIVVGHYDALAVPGGFEDRGFYEDAFQHDVSDLIRRFHQSRKVIASICVGALALGKSGILRDKQATTYHLSYGIRRKQLAAFGARIQNRPIVMDGNVITSTAPATALDVAFLLLERLTSRANLQKVKTAMGFPGESGAGSIPGMHPWEGKTFTTSKEDST